MGGFFFGGGVLESFVVIILFKIDVFVLGVFFNVLMIIIIRRRFIEIF